MSNSAPSHHASDTILGFMHAFLAQHGHTPVLQPGTVLRKTHKLLQEMFAMAIVLEKFGEPFDHEAFLGLDAACDLVAGALQRHADFPDVVARDLRDQVNLIIDMRPGSSPVCNDATRRRYAAVVEPIRQLQGSCAGTLTASGASADIVRDLRDYVDLFGSNEEFNRSVWHVRSYDCLKAMLPAAIFLEQAGEPVTYESFLELDPVCTLIQGAVERHGEAFEMVASHLCHRVSITPGYQPGAPRQHGHSSIEWAFLTMPVRRLAHLRQGRQAKAPCATTGDLHA